MIFYKVMRFNLKGYIPANKYVYMFDDNPIDIHLLNGWENSGKIPGPKSKPLFQLKKESFCRIDTGQLLKIKKICLFKDHQYRMSISGYLFDPEKGKVGKLLNEFPLNRILPFE